MNEHGDADSGAGRVVVWSGVGAWNVRHWQLCRTTQPHTSTW